VKCLDMSIDLRLMVTEDIVWSIEANRPDMRRDTLD